jgi:hypothetical protein
VWGGQDDTLTPELQDLRPVEVTGGPNLKVIVGFCSMDPIPSGLVTNVPFQMGEILLRILFLSPGWPLPLLGFIFIPFHLFVFNLCCELFGENAGVSCLPGLKLSSLPPSLCDFTSVHLCVSVCDISACKTRFPSGFSGQNPDTAASPAGAVHPGAGCLTSLRRAMTRDATGGGGGFSVPPSWAASLPGLIAGQCRAGTLGGGGPLERGGKTLPCCLVGN